LGILEELGQLTFNAADTCGNHQPKLSKQSADLVGLSGARGDKSLTRPMQTQQCLLFCVLNRYKPHVRTANRFADRLCIRRIVLISLHVRLDELRRDELHCVLKLR
jgi:hypothetical protein